MAPDFFESDQLAPDAEMAGQPETVTDEPPPAALRPAKRSLFQIVCLQAKPKPPAAL